MASSNLLEGIKEFRLNLGTNVLMCSECGGFDFKSIVNAVGNGTEIKAKIIQLECVTCKNARGVVDGVIQAEARRIVPNGR